MRKIRYITLLFFALSFSACQSVLDEDLYSELDGEYANSPQGLESLLNSAYGQAQLREYYFFYTSGMTSGETWGRYGSIESNFTPLSNFTWDANHPYFNNLWNRLYAAVRDANTILYNTSDRQEAEQLRAQAKFIRGFAYLTLYDWYGALPLYSSPQDDYYLAKSTKQETIAFIEQDLLEAADVLPESQSIYGKATKGAALSFLSRLYLNTQQWQKAADVAKQVIDLGIYSLYSDYTKLFLIDNEQNAEMIWVVQSNPKQGNPFIANTYPTDYPHLPNQIIYASEVHLYDDFVRSFLKKDKRKDLIITSYTSTKGEDKQLLGNNTTIPGKYEFDKNAIGASYGNDIPIIRYADILLSRAEALNELHGPTQEAIALFNQVHERAGLDPIVLRATKDSFRDQIFQERRWEFWFEQSRRTDQIRQGTYIPEAQARGKKAAKDFHVLFPIPQTEIDANANLEQNEGY